MPSRPATSPVRPLTRRPGARRSGRRWLRLALTFVAVVLLVNTLVGERGLIQQRRVRQDYAQLEASLTALRRENARLRDHARRLREDPRAVEEAARRELGLMRPDEMVFILKDAAPASRSAASGR